MTDRDPFGMTEATQLGVRLHVLDGIVLAIEQQRSVLDILTSSADRDEALARLASGFGLDAMQGAAVLDLQWNDLLTDRRRRLIEEHAEARRAARRLHD